MVWVDVIDKEPSKFNSYSYVVKFNFFGREEHAIITDKVLNFVSTEKVRIDSIEVKDKIFVTKGFNAKGDKIFFIKKCQKAKN